MGFVLAVYSSPLHGLPMIERASLKAIVGIGLEGDRYARTAIIAQSSLPHEKICDATLIEMEAINEAHFPMIETRHNIVTVGVCLRELVGKVFRVGDVLMRGIESTPCKCKRTFDTPFKGSCGLRAEIITSGLIIGAVSRITLEEKQYALVH